MRSFFRVILHPIMLVILGVLAYTAWRCGFAAVGAMIAATLTGIGIIAIVLVATIYYSPSNRIKPYD